MNVCRRLLLGFGLAALPHGGWALSQPGAPGRFTLAYGEGALGTLIAILDMPSTGASTMAGGVLVSRLDGGSSYEVDTDKARISARRAGETARSWSKDLSIAEARATTTALAALDAARPRTMPWPEARSLLDGVILAAGLAIPVGAAHPVGYAEAIVRREAGPRP